MEVVPGAGSGGFMTRPSMYPSNPLEPRSWVILVDHLSRLSPLNFCSSESIVSVGIPDIVDRGKMSRSSSQSRVCGNKS